MFHVHDALLFNHIMTDRSSDPHSLIVLLQVVLGVHLALVFDRDEGSFLSEL